MNASPVITNPYLFTPPELHFEKVRCFQPLYEPHRYKVAYGGRGGMKSWTFAQALIEIAHSRKIRVLCARELQTSIKDSVHRLLVDQIDAMRLTSWFEVTTQSIIALATGSEFIFKGLHHNMNEIKSTEGVDICWVEEAQLVADESWELLIPTIRKEGSEIWISMNPIEETDATYVRFIKNPPPDCVLIYVNYDQNPWMPATLEAERLHLLRTDPIAYEHVWLGKTRTITEAVIFRGKFVIEAFDTPTAPEPRFFHGLDFGYAGDPMALTRSYITGEPPNEHLWIDQEVVAYNVEIDEYDQLLRKGCPSSARWPIKADNARPESISYLRRRGFNISAADKWAGSVEDGIAHLKAFRKIHIHTRCTHHREEARLYSWKVDKVSRQILPIIVDAHNHCWDADRYALDGYIKRRGAGSTWSKL